MIKMQEQYKWTASITSTTQARLTQI